VLLAWLNLLVWLVRDSASPKLFEIPMWRKGQGTDNSKPKSNPSLADRMPISASILKRKNYDVDIQRYLTALSIIRLQFRTAIRFMKNGDISKAIDTRMMYSKVSDSPRSSDSAINS
jgi:hypothetical protein